VQFPDGNFCDFPYYQKNIKHLLTHLNSEEPKSDFNRDAIQSFQKTTEAIEKKLFSNASDESIQVKNLWHEIIRKINIITVNNHGLRELVEHILDLPFLQNFQSSIILLHLKGQIKAEIIGTLWRGDKAKGFFEVREFNQLFNSVKKSKIKSFNTDSFEKLNLPFNGSFLAKEVTSMKYSLVAIVSRHDFLPYSPEEIELFETSIDLLQPHFERLIDQEFSDQKISELRVCLKEFPLPLRVLDNVSGSSFINDLFSNELQNKDIFFSKKIKGSFSLDLYDSDELRHYAFDLFHFQRISLLGELLNTLRHELSNPLFGLKLGAQIFGTLEISQDNKEIMLEVEKNINRCQQIIENFSNLYRSNSEKITIAVKKLIDESIILSKSESREVLKKIHYHDDTENLQLDVPLIFVVQILFNLVVNASQSMRSMGSGQKHLFIDISRVGDFVLIDVIDNGPGVPEEKIGQLFKPFFTTKPQGTGLGLVLSRNLAQKMGGNLEYLTNAARQGAHFRLSLPIS
jgi:signal transduction histidine kinase